jgi:hypothetical protein
MKGASRHLINAILCLMMAGGYTYGLIVTYYPNNERQIKKFVDIIMVIISVGWAVNFFLEYKKDKQPFSPVQKDNPVVD